MNLDDITLLNRQLQIDMAINKYKPPDEVQKMKLYELNQKAIAGCTESKELLNKIILKSNRNKLIIKHLHALFILIEKAIDGNLKAINYLTKNKIPNFPELAIDGEGRVYKYSGILFENLQQFWKKFDYKHKGSLKVNYYLEGLNTFLNKTQGIRGAKIELIYTMTKNQYGIYKDVNSKEHIPLVNLINNKK